MTDNKFGITLLFTKNILQGINLVGYVPYEIIQIFKNDIMKMEIPISIIKNQDFETYLFPDTYIVFDKDDKIGFKLKRSGMNDA